jgi:hypothetical protein
MISLVLIFIAGIAKSFMDAAAHGKLPWRSSFWSEKAAWRNKWRWVKTGVIDWETGIEETVIDGEKFWGSSRWFVFVTSGWHLMQFFCFNILILAVVLYKPMTNIYLDFIILRAGFAVPFYVIYEKSLK